MVCTTLRAVSYFQNKQRKVTPPPLCARGGEREGEREETRGALDLGERKYLARHADQNQSHDSRGGAAATLLLPLRPPLRRATSPRCRACSYVELPKLRGMREQTGCSPSVSSPSSVLSREGKTARPRMLFAWRDHGVTLGSAYESGKSKAHAHPLGQSPAATSSRTM